MSKKKNGARVKAAVPAVVIATRNAADIAVAEIGSLQRRRDFIQTKMNDELSLVRQRYEDEAAPHGARILDLARGVQAWADVNRDDLTGGKSKTVALSAGELAWRMTPPSVSLKGVDAIIALLKGMRLKRFLRIKFEVNKEAVLAERDNPILQKVKGLSINQCEEFVIKPFETELEEVAP